MGIPAVSFLFDRPRPTCWPTPRTADGGQARLHHQPGVPLEVTRRSRMLPSAQLRDRETVAFLDRGDAGDRARDDPTECTRRPRPDHLRHDYILPGTTGLPARGQRRELQGPPVPTSGLRATQHMEFLNVPPAPRCLVEADGSAHLITSRGASWTSGATCSR